MKDKTYTITYSVGGIKIVEEHLTLPQVIDFIQVNENMKNGIIIIEERI